MNIENYIDHTILKPTTIAIDVAHLCEEAIKNQFFAVCIPPNFVEYAVNLLQDSDVAVATVIGFPFGYACTEAKVAEAKKAIQDGVDEIDMVINISDVKSGNWDKISKELSSILQPIRLNNKLLKVILESGVLTDEEIVKCCEICTKHKVDFVKTSTGYAENGASVHAVSLMRKNLPKDIQIKASGGIRNFQFAKELIDAGATRIGASSSVKIVTEAR